MKIIRTPEIPRLLDSRFHGKDESGDRKASVKSSPISECDCSRLPIICGGPSDASTVRFVAQIAFRYCQLTGMVEVQVTRIGSGVHKKRHIHGNSKSWKGYRAVDVGTASATEESRNQRIIVLGLVSRCSISMSLVLMPLSSMY